METNKFFQGEVERDIRPLPKIVSAKLFYKEDEAFLKIVLTVKNLAYWSTGKLCGDFELVKYKVEKKSKLNVNKRNVFQKILDFLSGKQIVKTKTFFLQNTKIWKTEDHHRGIVQSNLSCEYGLSKNEFAKAVTSDLANHGVVLNSEVCIKLFLACKYKVEPYVDEFRAYSQFETKRKKVLS